MGIEGTYLNITKAICDRPIANILLKSEKLNAFTVIIRNKARMPTPPLPTFIQHSIGSPCQRS